MAPDPERVQVAVADGVADVRLTRAAKHNGLDWPMFEAINAALDDLFAAEELRSVVLSGEGPSFCAGLDFKSFASGGGGDLAGDGFARGEGEAANFAQRVAYGWRELPVPVVAALQGACFGGGLQIALAADIRIAAPDTRMSVMEIEYGLIPDMSLSTTLPRLVRDDVAAELTFTGRVVEAEEALALGLVTRIDPEPLTVARVLAAEIAAKPPRAIRSAKRLLGLPAGGPDAERLALESELQKRLIGDTLPPSREG
ncbi:MAG: crotonase/enoyl-CoA hydratase family protein [Solirubrobacterales bacterium]